jgi:hypothetical protein
MAQLAAASLLRALYHRRAEGQSIFLVERAVFAWTKQPVSVSWGGTMGEDRGEAAITDEHEPGI